MRLPCVVTGHKSQRSTLKNQIPGAVFIYKVISVKVRKISEHCALSRIFNFCRRERGSAVSNCTSWLYLEIWIIFLLRTFYFTSPFTFEVIVALHWFLRQQKYPSNLSNFLYVCSAHNLKRVTGLCMYLQLTYEECLLYSHVFFHIKNHLTRKFPCWQYLYWIVYKVFLT